MNKYDEKILELEEEELQVPSSDANLYSRLMAYYLVRNKLFEAKFLWRRISQNVKADNNELQNLHELERSIICNNYAEVFKSINNTEWSEEIKIVMDDLKVITMEHILHLIGNAYTSLLDETLMELTGILEEDQMKQKCLELEWAYETCDQQIVVHPKKPVSKLYDKAESEYQLSKLTEFVSFLEN